MVYLDDAERGGYLVAYLTAKAGERPAPAEFRDWLRARLPEYMLPAHFVLLEAFPLTPNGKLDRAALPLPTRYEQLNAGSIDAPTTEMEKLLAEIWAELLDIDDIDRNDMFFDLGGHSLLILKVVDRFEQETGIRLAPANLVSQSLRQLAAAVEPGASAAVADDASDKSVNFR